MTVEDRLRDALGRRADSIVPGEPQWSHVADRVAPRARRRQTLAILTTSLAAVLIAAAVAVSIVRAQNGNRPVHTLGLGALTSTSSRPPTPTTGPAAATSTTAAPPTTLASVGPPGGPVPAGFTPVSVTWISARQGWVLGTATCDTPPCTSMVRTTDGGATWLGVPAPPAPPHQGVAAGVLHVRFADAMNGWASGPELWATHDGGSTWHRVGSPGGDAASPVLALEAAGGTVYAVAGLAPTRLFASEVGSESWHQVAADDIDPGSAVALHGTTGYVQGKDGAVRALTATGLDRRGSPCGATPSAALTVAGTDVAALCVTDAGAGSSSKTLVVSHDAARTWVTAGSAPRGGMASGLAAASASTYVVAADSGASFLYRSGDGGATWTTVSTDSTLGGAPFADLGFSDASRGFAVIQAPPPTGGRLLATADGGNTWAAAKFGP